MLRVQSKKFKIDSEISKKNKAERNLKQWQSEGPEITLENENRHWDQFEVNKNQFGVKSTYDEELYTTKKVTADQLSYDQIKRALKIEKEIYGKETKDEGLEEDEEKLYGAVIGSGRYVDNEVIETFPKRERAISMASCGEITKDEYKKTREYLMNPHKAKIDSTAPQMKLLEALNLNISQPFSEEAIISFIKFKEGKQPSRDNVIKEFKEFSNKFVKKDRLEIIREENKKPISSVVDLYLENWRDINKNDYNLW